MFDESHLCLHWRSETPQRSHNVNNKIKAKQLKDPEKTSISQAQIIHQTGPVGSTPELYKVYINNGARVSTKPDHACNEDAANWLKNPFFYSLKDLLRHPQLSSPQTKWNLQRHMYRENKQAEEIKSEVQRTVLSNIKINKTYSSDWSVACYGWWVVQALSALIITRQKWCPAAGRTEEANCSKEGCEKHIAYIKLTDIKKVDIWRKKKFCIFECLSYAMVDLKSPIQCKIRFTNVLS